MKKLISIILSVVMLVSTLGGMSMVASAQDYDTIVSVSSNTAFKDYEFTYYIELDGQPYSPTVLDKNDDRISVKDGYFKLKGDNTAYVSFDREGSFKIKRMAATIGENELVESEQSGTVGFKYSKSVDGIINFLTEDEYNAQTENGTKTSAIHYVNEKGEICDSDTIAPCTYYPAGTVVNEEIDDCYYDTAKATVIPVKYTFTATHTTEAGKLGDRHKYNGTVTTSTTKAGYITSLVNNETFSTVSIASLQLAQTQAYGLISAIVGTFNNKIVEALTPEGTVGRNVVLTSITPEAASLVATDTTKVDNVIVNYCIYTRLAKSHVVFSKYLQPSKEKVQFTDRADVTILKLGENKISVNEDGTEYFFTPKESDIYTFSFTSDKEVDFEFLLNEQYVRESMFDYKDKNNCIMAARLEAGKKYTIPVSSYDGDAKVSLTISKGHPYKFESIAFDLTHALTVTEKIDGFFDEDINAYYYALSTDIFKKGDKMIFTTTDGEKVVYEYDRDKYAFVCGDSEIGMFDIDFYDEQEEKPWTETGAYPVTISTMLMNYDTNVYLLKASQLIHDYTQVVTKPTCTTDGYTTNSCSTCDAEYVSNIVYASHTLAEPVEENRVEPTCAKTGSYDTVVYCSVCEKEISRKQETIPTIAHTYKTTTTTKATTSADGKKVTKCTVCGNVKSTTTIKKVSTVKLSATSYIYDGKVKSPTLTVKDSSGKTLVKGTDYTVTTPTGRKNVGKYTYKITFKGNYSGTKSLSFTIVPKTTSISALTAASKGFTVKWKKQATQTTGYEIQIATDSKFTKGVKSYTVSKNSTVSKKITKLTGSKKYYVRIRTYKTVSGTKYYSSWSGSKTVTTKK